MAARTRKIKHDDATRDKIRTSQLVKRLTAHALSEKDPQSKKVVMLTATQVRAIEILLRKTLPDLQSIQGDMAMHLTHEQMLDELE
jgi:hypothetical protein